MSDTMSAIEYENLEQKLIETKSKLKKSLHYNERYTIQIQKLNKRVRKLENDNKDLENQLGRLRSTARDTSESDVSSQTNHHEERAHMVDLVQSKNQQISELLKDIEDMEDNNIILREKLLEAKDHLALATTEIATMTETLETHENRCREQEEKNTKILSENDDLRQELANTKMENNKLEDKIAKLTNDFQKAELEWKVTLDTKDMEIKQLQSRLPPTDVETITCPTKEDQMVKTSEDKEIDILKATLSDTEDQLAQLKEIIANYTIDLRENTKIINRLKGDNELLTKRIEDIKETKEQLKEQMKKAQDRCESLQREVEHANKLTKLFENDLSVMKNHLKEDGRLEVIANLEAIQTLKIEKLLLEKHIISLVKDVNKLQEICNTLEIENASLREHLGLSPDESVDVDSNILTNSEKQKKIIEALQLEKMKIQDDKIKLKIEIKNLKRQLSAVRESENIQGETDLHSATTKDNWSAEIKALSEENEGLRKGLHEILESVQAKKEKSPRELKTDVLERLLRALDVKHISGWYHPAMRLQAELHNLEGVNSELREQLSEVRTELDKLKSTPTPRERLSSDVDEELGKIASPTHNKSVFDDLFNSDTSSLEKIRINVLNILVHIIDSDGNFKEKLESEFNILKTNLESLHANCNNKQTKPEHIDVGIEPEMPSTYENMSREDIVKLICIEKKKNVTMFNQMIHLAEEVRDTKIKSDSLMKTQSLETETFLKKLVALRRKLHFKEIECSNLVGIELFKEIQDSLNGSILKYRHLLTETEQQRNNRELEIRILEQKDKDSSEEINNLKDTLNKALRKFHQDSHTNEQDVLPLAQKLADAEVQALSEKHRADHTNNLYELVKEQLKKSEEKFIEFSKYGDGLLQKNLVLQERTATLEDQLALFVDPEIVKELQNNLNTLIKEKDILTEQYDDLNKKYHQQINSSQQTTNWTKEKEQELLELKHKMIDLTSASDQSAVIDQLYNNLSKSRAELKEHQLQLEFLRKEVSNWESRYVKLCAEMEERKSHFESDREALDRKIGLLQDVILKQRIQYHGFIPLSIQECLVAKINSIRKEKHEAFILLQKNMPREMNDKKVFPKIADYTGGCQQIEYLQQKIQNQDSEIQRLESELFSAYKLMDFNGPPKVVSVTRRRRPILVRELVCQESLEPTAHSEVKEEKPTDIRSETKMMILRNVESQTEIGDDHQLTEAKVQVTSLETQLSIRNNRIAEMEELLQRKNIQLNELEEQLKQREGHLTSLQDTLKSIREKEKNRIETPYNGGGGDGAGIISNHMNEEIVALKMTLKNTQDRIKQKDVEIIKYQTLLKEDRDKHSMAAATLQQELVVMRKMLLSEQEDNKRLQQESTASRQKSAIVEKYVNQVRALEKHLADLHTQLAQLQAQLQSAHQEATRWRQMAKDRLVAMQELGKSLNERHNKDLSSYKTDYEKLKELSEEDSPKTVVPEQKLAGYIDPDILKLCKEKDGKIEELTTKLKQIESGEAVVASPASAPSKENLTKEHEILRGKYEALVNKERNLKEEIRDLREQLSRRVNLSARSQKSERTVKEQLQKRINSLEREVQELSDKLTQERQVNEKHRMAAHEDFEKWKKQKYWQEHCEKYKKQLQEKEEDFQKLQQTCSGFRLLIERLEREKINLEDRVKTLKQDRQNMAVDQEKVFLLEENARLSAELAASQSKMEMRQQGAGVLGAALMQEKLEAQERKIAVLELSNKGSVELRNELERLQTTMTNFQKINLCLEAENMELKLDLEKHTKETPQLQQQIQHLESYVEILKNENQKQTTIIPTVESSVSFTEDKKVSQMEKTIGILKRLVEKLQTENKRLLSGKRTISELPSVGDKLRRDHIRLKERYTESLQKIKDLEVQLQNARKGYRHQHSVETNDQLRSQLSEIKEQLLQKTQLLDKVKSLLHTAAAREKQFLKEIAELKAAPAEEKESHVDIPSPIEEVSEVSDNT